MAIYTPTNPINDLSFNPWIMTADTFGKYYVHSNKWRQNQRKRKQLAKMNKRK